jgi:hypothetical protein
LAVSSNRSGERPTYITIEATRSVAWECQKRNVGKGHMVRISLGKFINHSKNQNIIQELVTSMSFQEGDMT